MFRFSQDSRIVIDVSAKTLSLYQEDQLVKSYPIAIGKTTTPTPLGQWEVINKKILSDNGVFGNRWIGLSAPGYGIHGTNNPSSIGTAASLGCIRLYNENVEELFNLVTLHTPVTILSKNTPSSATYYQIKSGDTLWQIAQAYHLPLEKLLGLNPNLNPQSLEVGKKINLN